MKNNNPDEAQRIKAMLDVVEDCIKQNKLELLAKILYELQAEYYEVCRLATDDEYQISWTHQQVLDHLTYNQKY